MNAIAARLYQRPDGFWRCELKRKGNVREAIFADGSTPQDALTALTQTFSAMLLKKPVILALEETNAN